MRRLARFFLNALTVLSLLFVATVALWVRGYWREDVVGWTQPARPPAECFYFDVTSGSGGLLIHVGHYAHHLVPTFEPEGWRWVTYGPGPIPRAGEPLANRLGLGYARTGSPLFRGRAVTVPAWLPAALFAALPLARVALFVRRRRRGREGHCKTCGYDLRATPDRCPECGAAAVANDLSATG